MPIEDLRSLPVITEVRTAEPDGETSASFSRRTKTKSSFPIHHDYYSHTRFRDYKIPQQKKGRRFTGQATGSPRDSIHLPDFNSGSSDGRCGSGVACKTKVKTKKAGA